MSKITFAAVLPQDAAMPIKPTRDFNAATGKRRVRVWIDAFLAPGETETLLLMGEKELRVTVEEAQLSETTNHIHCVVCQMPIPLGDAVSGDKYEVPAGLIEAKAGLSLFEFSAKRGDAPSGGVLIRVVAHKTCFAGVEPEARHQMANDTTYTDEQVGHALAVLESMNGNAKRAAATLGIPRTTLRQWAGRAQSSTAHPKQVTAEVVNDKRLKIRDNVETFLVRATDRASTEDFVALMAEKPKDLLIGIGIATEKMELLSGRATTRSESLRIELVAGNSLRELAERTMTVQPDPIKAIPPRTQQGTGTRVVFSPHTTGVECIFHEMSGRARAKISPAPLDQLAQATRAKPMPGAGPPEFWRYTLAPHSPPDGGPHWPQPNAPLLNPRNPRSPQPFSRSSTRTTP